MMPQHDDLWIAEETLATELGLSRGLLVVARAERPPDDTEQRSGFVFWKKSAAQEFARGIGLVLPESAEPAPEAEELTVTSSPGMNGLHYPNPRVIQAKRKSGELVYVTVKCSDKFLPKLAGANEPMLVTAVKNKSSGGWVLVGREPRWKGRW